MRLLSVLTMGDRNICTCPLIELGFAVIEGVARSLVVEICERKFAVHGFEFLNQYLFHFYGNIVGRDFPAHQ